MQSIDRIVSILNILKYKSEGIGINEISEISDLPLSTSHRILSSLKKHGYVSQDPITKRYKLGIEILALAVNLLNDTNIINHSRGPIENLSSKYKELVFLSVLENGKVFCMDMINSAEGMKYFVQIGAEMPSYCSASAKAIIAFQDRDIIEMILGGQEFRRFTDKTICKVDKILEDMDVTKKKGYAVCDEEMEYGVRALATPIYDRSGSILASITIMLKSHLIYNEEEIIKDLKSTSRKISKSLGYNVKGVESW